MAELIAALQPSTLIPTLPAGSRAGGPQDGRPRDDGAHDHGAHDHGARGGGVHDGGATWGSELDLRMDRATPARMYDYYLGGKDHYAVDRAAAERVAAVLGAGLRDAVLENRAFVRRAVRWIAEQGIGQYLDLGVGLPTQGNVHEFAQHIVPGARVVYVDNDPIVLAHGRALLADDRSTMIVTADLREPAAVLRHATGPDALDFSRPVGVLFAAVLHFVAAADHPAEVVAQYWDALAPGSFLALSHLTGDGHPAHEVDTLEQVYQEATSPLTARSRDEISGLLPTGELIEPGLVRSWQWRPDTEGSPQTGWTYAVVVRKR